VHIVGFTTEIPLGGIYMRHTCPDPWFQTVKKCTTVVAYPTVRLLPEQAYVCRVEEWKTDPLQNSGLCFRSWTRGLQYVTIWLNYRPQGANKAEALYLRSTRRIIALILNYLMHILGWRESEIWPAFVLLCLLNDNSLQNTSQSHYLLSRVTQQFPLYHIPSFKVI
jgi:hypothetical protein